MDPLRFIKSWSLSSRFGTDRGSVLLIALWTCSILSILALGISRISMGEASALKNSIGRLRAQYIAWAGFIYSINLIRHDNEDPASNTWDTIPYCAVSPRDGKNPGMLFNEIAASGGTFNVDHLTMSGSFVPNIRYGFQDEDSKINLNAINQHNHLVLARLIELLGFEDALAEAISSAVVDCHDEDNIALTNPFITEGDEYGAYFKAHRYKNRPFDCIEELMLVKGMTPEVFSKIKDYVTVYPKVPLLLSINILTAPEIVILSLAQGIGERSSILQSDSEVLVRKLLKYRQGQGNLFPEDADLGLSEREVAIYQNMKQNLTTVSRFIRIHLTGVDRKTFSRSKIDAVIDRKNLSVVYWHRD